MTTAVQAVDFTSFIFANGEELKTTSLKIAEAFGKRHDHVLRDVKKIISSIAGLEHAPKFGEMLIDVEIGNGAIKKSPAYEMDKDGFMLVVMGYTGEAAMKIKVAYINAFNLMHDKLFPKKKYGLIEPTTISTEQIGELYTRVCAISSDGKIRTAIWSRFQNHFRINSYKVLPAEKYDEALTYVEKLHAEYHPKSEPVLTEQQYRRVMNRADYLSKTQCATPLMSIVETIRKEFKVSDIRSIPEAKFAQLCNFLNFSPEQNERDLLVDYFRANDLIERMKKDYIILKKDDPCIIPHFVQQVETLLLPELITQSAAALAVRL